MKQYLGILISVLYAIVVRFLAENAILDINSYSYLIVTPMLVGFIPFYLKQESFLQSRVKTILFPLISVLLFLIIAVISRWEDLICFAIIGIPYIFLSIFMSILLRHFLKKDDKGINKNVLPIFLLPIILGSIEQQFPKNQQELFISNEIEILASKQEVWSNLLEVPDLSKEKYNGLIHYFDVPRPIKSTYDAKSNIRLGYFENGIVLNESVVQNIEYKKLVFSINISESELNNSPTLRHVLESQSIEFKSISYELTSIGENKTKLRLNTQFKIHSNLSFYGKFWSKMIIEDFEKNLLNSLKSVIEG
ncbi:MAG: hypothetical protein COA33_009280 [Fluviicola sp.]|nr:hypothetical protein [Fluviicola sp.]